ncbi:MAG: hypothetical protein CL534_11820 [Ahrensia sp.]|nr:hypothetical protein [Ahrensia sp.]
MTILLCWAVVASFARSIEGTWWSPGSFLALALSTNAFGTIVFAPEYFMSLAANIYLQSLVIVTSFAAFIGRRFVSSRPVVAALVPKRAFEVQRKQSLFFFGLVTSVASAFFTLRATGVGIGDLTSVSGLMQSAQEVTYRRYTEGLDFPIYYNVSNALLLSYAVTVAIHFAAVRRIEWRFTLPIAIYVVANMLVTTRAPILFLLIPMIFGALFTAKSISKDGKFASIGNTSTLKVALSATALVAAIFFLFQLLRFGEQSDRSASEVWTHLRKYPWGSLPAFSSWYDQWGRADSDAVSGYYTFMGIYDNLGIAARQALTYDEFVFLSRGEPANVYTVFRGLYHDFGMLGSGMFLALCGFLGAAAAWGNWATPYFRTALYVAIMTFMACAFVVSSFAYTSNIAAVLALPFMLRYFTAAPSYRLSSISMKENA